MADQYKAPDKSNMFSAAILQATAQAKASAQGSYAQAKDYFVGAQGLQLASDDRQRSDDLMQQGNDALEAYIAANDKRVDAISKLAGNVDKMYNKYNGTGTGKVKVDLSARVAAARAKRNEFLIDEYKEINDDRWIEAGELFSGKTPEELITREMPYRDPLTIGNTYMNYPKLFWDTAGIDKQDYYMELNKKLTPSEVGKLYGRSGWKGFTHISLSEQYNWLSNKVSSSFDALGNLINKAPDKLYDIFGGND